MPIEVVELASSTNWPAELFESVDAVVHMADTGVRRGATAEEDSLSAFREANLDSVIKLAEAAASVGVSRFVYLSSTEVERLTGGDGVTPQTAMSPEDYYAISKQEGEQALKAVGLITGMEMVMLRAPEVYGRRCDGWVASLIRTLRAGESLPFAGVDNRLALIHEQNLADALLLAATHPEAANETWTVSDAEQLSTPALLEALGRHVPEFAGLKKRPRWLLKLAASLPGQGAVLGRFLQSSAVDTSVTRQRLGWQPPVSAEEGLRQAVEFQKTC